MDDRRKLSLIEMVLVEEIERGDMSSDVIRKIRILTGDKTFCGPQAAGISTLVNRLELRVDTWEDDCDQDCTTVLQGLMPADVRFFVDVCGLFGRQHPTEIKISMGNEYVHHYSLLYAISDLIQRHQDVSDDVKTKWLFDQINELGLLDNPNIDPINFHDQNKLKQVGDAFYQLLVDNILGRPRNNDYGFCRVFNKYKVFGYVNFVRTDMTAQYPYVPHF